MSDKQFELLEDMHSPGSFEIRSTRDTRFSQHDLSVFLMIHGVQADSITRIWGVGELSLDGAIALERLEHLALDLRVPKGIPSSVSLCPHLKVIVGNLTLYGPCSLPSLHTVLGDTRFSADASIPSLVVCGGEVVATRDGYPVNLLAAGGRVWVSNHRQTYDFLRFVGRDVSQATSVRIDPSARRAGHADCAEFMGRDAAIEAGRRWLAIRDMAHEQLDDSADILDGTSSHDVDLSL